MSGESNGVYLATVVSSTLDEQGRIEIEIPSRSSRYHALFASALSGKDRGVVFLPDQGDQVVVAFVNGIGNIPVVLGSLWSNVAKPPIDNADGNNHLKLIRTRSGHQIRLSDEPGKEAIEIVDKTGKNRILIDSANKKVSIEATDGEIALDAGKVTITADQELKLSSTKSTVDIEAKGTTTVKGQTIDLNP